MQAICSYLDYTQRGDALSGGSRRIPIETPVGWFEVWVKRVGNSCGCRVLLLHGGPGCTHEYFEAFDSFLPAAGIEYYYYDQLGSGRSDRPDDPSLWELDRFVDEVEQVRVALGLGAKDLVLLGHSWGGILAIEYALAYQQNLRALVISNMMPSNPAFARYAEHVLGGAMDPGILLELREFENRGAVDDPRYREILVQNFYEKHLLRMPYAEWPDPARRAIMNINPAVSRPMKGDQEIGMSPKARLAQWDRTDDLASIAVPTLVIGSRYDTMDPAQLAAMARQLPKGRYHECAEGSHLAMYDDQEAYFDGLVPFLLAVRDGDAPR